MNKLQSQPVHPKPTSSDEPDGEIVGASLPAVGPRLFATDDEGRGLLLNEISPADPARAKLIRYYFDKADHDLAGYEITKAEVSKLREQNATLIERTKYVTLKEIVLLVAGGLLGLLPSAISLAGGSGGIILGVIFLALVGAVFGQEYLSRRSND